MAMALGVVGAVVSAVGQFQAMQAQAAAAEYNQKVAERNAKAVRGQTDSEINDKRVHNRRVLGTMRAAYASNGFEMVGSPMDVIADTAFEQEYDVAKMKYQGDMKAEGYKEQATLFEMEAKASRRAAFIGLASGLLSGVGEAIQV